MLKSKPVRLESASEKRPFEVGPFFRTSSGWMDRTQPAKKVSCVGDSPQLTNRSLDSNRGLDCRDPIESDILRKAANRSEVEQGAIRLDTKGADRADLPVEAVQEFAIRNDRDIGFVAPVGFVPRMVQAMRSAFRW